MSNVIVTPNMNLPNPVPGQDPGPDYANNLQSSLNIIDQHDHGPGSGVQITPAGIDVNTDLQFNSNNATLLRSVRFLQLNTPLSLSTDVACLYSSKVSSNAELFYNDSSGNEVQITSGGAVNATSSGISNGSASASFSGGVLIVNQATNTPGNIQLGSLLLGNNTAGSNFLTLKPPSAMGSSYSLTLPSIPSSTQFVTLDTSGNLATATSVAATQIANQAIQQAQLQARSTGLSVGAGGVAYSPTIGSYSNGTTTYTAMSSNITLVTTGRPVCLVIGWDSTNSGTVGNLSTGGSPAQIAVTDSAQSVNYYVWAVQTNGNASVLGGLTQILFLAAGTYNFTLRGKLVSGSGPLTSVNVSLTAYEI